MESNNLISGEKSEKKQNKPDANYDNIFYLFLLY